MKHHILDKTFWVYTAIAVACWCVGTGLMFLLYNCLHVGYWIASACNYLVGGTMSYFLNRKYTFHSHDNRLSNGALVNCCFLYQLYCSSRRLLSIDTLLT